MPLAVHVLRALHESALQALPLATMLQLLCPRQVMATFDALALLVLRALALPAVFQVFVL